jgi:hypothetical protein
MAVFAVSLELWRHARPHPPVRAPDQPPGRGAVRVAQLVGQVPLEVNPRRPRPRRAHRVARADLGKLSNDLPAMGPASS